ncbi:MAG: hypothetical protein MZW92_73740 [Comamonadaceae bacterium]|nr:hypothetical protein [Comamonadaceae bacterium]
MFRTQAAAGRGREQDRRASTSASSASRIKDKSKVFNTARIEALELDNLIEAAQATMVSAEARTESRGAHVATTRRHAEYPDGRDDAELAQAHAVVQRKATGSTTSRCNLKPLTVESVAAQGRARY